MAKQVGPVFFTGTIDGIIFYKLGDKYYSRSKGSYKSAKHMRRNPRYKRTMQKAHQFGDASKLTQEVYYRYLPKAIRKHGLFGQLTGLVNGWLQQGKTWKEATAALIYHCKMLAATATPSAPKETIAVVKTPASPAATAAPVGKPASKASTMLHPATAIKQARYLSNWKVKTNGRLQSPMRLDRSSSAAADFEPLRHLEHREKAPKEMVKEELVA